MELFRKHHPDTNIAKNGQEVSILFFEETGAKRIKGGSQREELLLCQISGHNSHAWDSGIMPPVQ